MPWEKLAEYGAAVLIAIVAIKAFDLIKYLIDRRNVNNETDNSNDKVISQLNDFEKTFIAIQSDISWLKDAHDEKDEDGVYLWYVRRSLEKAVWKMVENGNKVLATLNELLKELKNKKERIIQ